MQQGVPGSLRRSLSIQGRVIGALLMREIMTRYGRHNVGFLWLFLEPLLFTLGVLLLWSMVRTMSAQLPIIPFAITGYTTILMWRSAGSRCASAVQANRGLLFHRNVRLIDLFAARLVLEIAGATAAFLVLLLFFAVIGAIALPSDPATIVAGWLLLSWFTVGLGLVVGALSARFEVVERLWHTVTYLFFPLSGALFMVDWLPKAGQEFVLWVPMVHATEMLRDGYFGHLVVTHYDVGYFMLCNLVMTLLGLFMVRDLAGRVEGE